MLLNRLSKAALLIAVGGTLLTCRSSMDPRYLSPGAPTVTSISPNTGIVGGGQSVTITGTNFRVGLNSVALGGSACTVTSMTTTSITCTTSRHNSNAVDVVVTASDTLETGTLRNGYGYKAYLYSIGSSKIWSFAIDPFSGSLTATTTPSIAIPGSGYGINVHPSDKFLYVGDAGAAAGTNNLTGYTIDQSTGNLTIIASTGAPTSPQNPDAIAFTSDGNYMFAASAVAATNATVTSYIVNQTTGALTTNGATVTATNCRFGGQIIVDPNNANLYMSCNSGGNGDANAGLAAFAISASGTLTFTSFVHGGSGDAISMDLTGTYIYTGNTGGASGAAACGSGVGFDNFGGITVYAANSGNPTYIQSCTHNQNSGTANPRGSGSSVDQTNRWLVTSARVTGTIQVWDISNPSTPVLTTVQAATADTNDARFDKTGRFMYDSSLNSVDFYNFSISTGVPTFVISNTATGTPGVSDVTY